MGAVCWARFPLISRSPHARSWLTIQADRQLAAHTIAAYGRALEEYLHFCEANRVVAEMAGQAQVSAYVRHLAERPHPRPVTRHGHTPPSGLANATLQLKLTVVRLYYTYLVEEGVRPTNPVRRGAARPGTMLSASGMRGVLARVQPLPWIPSDDEFRAILTAAREEPLRNQYMLLLAYHCALRREELCGLTLADVRLEPREVRVRAESTKGRRERIVPYSDVLDPWYAAYLHHRHTLSRETGPLFLSESRRNYAQPLTIWTWSHVVARLAARAQLPQFSTHTLRHLRLTDLARSGWDLHAIALFAGHRRTETTMRYIHRSGRELADKLAVTMAEMHAWRSMQMAQVLAEPAR